MYMFENHHHINIPARIDSHDSKLEFQPPFTNDFYETFQLYFECIISLMILDVFILNLSVKKTKPKISFF